MVGVAILLIKLIKDLLFIKRLIKESKKIERDDDIIIAVHRQNISPFSWKNYIVITETDYKKESDIVICYVKHSFGGSGKMVDKAIRQKKKVINF